MTNKLGVSGTWHCIIWGSYSCVARMWRCIIWCTVQCLHFQGHIPQDLCLHKGMCYELFEMQRNTINTISTDQKWNSLFSKYISTRYIHSLLLYIHKDTIMLLTIRGIYIYTQLLENNQQKLKLLEEWQLSINCHFLVMDRKHVNILCTVEI
jgi:hypothetical protein